MKSLEPIAANPVRRMGVGQLALAVAAAWFGVHAAIYAVEMCRLDGVLYRHVEHVLKHFFGWQVAGFLVAAIVVSRPAAVGGGPRARRLSRAIDGGVAGVRAGRRDVCPTGRVALVDHLRRVRDAASDRPRGRPAIRDLGCRRGRRSTRHSCQSASSWASCTRSLRRSWPRWR